MIRDGQFDFSEAFKKKIEPSCPGVSPIVIVTIARGAIFSSESFPHENSFSIWTTYSSIQQIAIINIKELC